MKTIIIALEFLTAAQTDNKKQVIVPCETALVLAQKPGALSDNDYSRLFLLNHMECVSLPLSHPEQKRRVEAYEVDINRALDAAIKKKQHNGGTK